MTRAEKIAELNERMSDEQLDDALAMVRHGTTTQSVFSTLAPEHQARILKTKTDAEKGIGVQDAQTAFATSDAKLKSHGV